MTPHAFLRAETRVAHQRVDAMFGALDLARADDYRRFLVAHAVAFVPIEAALTRAGAERLVPDWTAHRRSAALLGDLADLGVIAPTADPGVIAATADPGVIAAAADPGLDFAGDGAILGGVYVLEGSRLGGQLLKRALAPGMPRRFLDAPQSPGRWRAIIATLDRILSDRRELDAARRASLQTFAAFEQAGSDTADA